MHNMPATSGSKLRKDIFGPCKIDKAIAELDLWKGHAVLRSRGSFLPLGSASRKMGCAEATPSEGVQSVLLLAVDRAA